MGELSRANEAFLKMLSQIEAISFYQFLQDPPSLITLEDVRKRLEGAKVHVSEDDYLLGLTDLTGELMRYGMNAIGNSGIQDGEAVVQLTERWVRQIRAGELFLLPRLLY
jgi:predicted translin family RNA/ssDNA-binding protein